MCTPFTSQSKRGIFSASMIIGVFNRCKPHFLSNNIYLHYFF